MATTRHSEKALPTFTNYGPSLTFEPLLRESEIVGHPHPESLNQSGVRWSDRLPIGGAVVPLNLHVRVEEPIQSDGDVLEAPAIDAFVVKVEIVEPRTYPPGPCSAIGVPLLVANQTRILSRLDPVEDPLLPIVVALFTGEKVQDLDVPPPGRAACPRWACSRERRHA